MERTEESKSDIPGFEFHEINLLDFNSKTVDSNYFLATTDKGFELY